ncbi:glycosyltransferase [Micromonospora sp. WMMD812]|uniref:glycosyltransferase n=1 Tax=Micromonospora sp. WMMD812 TaxID=3015152 RepID=UPI00248D0E5E|nr:glycosyltransferase [Micromonospora sp. WMMD812]WBB70086.1 glycosyltransferase [Micromonospora sp. WMMD812]
MADVLFVTWDGGGNVPPAVGVAAELRSRGHRVRFLGHQQQAAEFEAQGFDFTPYRAGRPYSSLAANSPATMISLFSTPGFGHDLLAEVDRQPADLVVIDCLLLSALRSAERAGLRHVALVHLFYQYLRGSWSRGPVGLLARLRGYRPQRSWSAADLTLVATLRDLDPAGRRSWPQRVRYTGPVLRPPAPAAREAEERQAILVSLSTNNFPGQPQALQAILDAVADLPARAIVTTGPAVDPAALRAPANAELHRFVPHDEVMPRVSLVIGHGGHATTMRALAHDLPLVVMPMHPMMDQPMVGRAVQDAGAGRLVRKGARPGELRATIAELLADGPHRRAAERLGQQIRDSHGAATAADALESLLPGPHGALSPPHNPPTDSVPA